MERQGIERRVGALHRALSEMRPPGRREARLASLVITDRIDREGNYHYIDPEAEEILGFPQDAYWKDVGWVQFTHPDDIGRAALLWQRAMAGRPCPLVEYRCVNADRQWVWLEDSFRPAVYDMQGRVLVVEGCWRDVTLRKRREIEFLLRQWEFLLRHAPPAPSEERGRILRFVTARALRRLGP